MSYASMCKAGHLLTEPERGHVSCKHAACLQLSLPSQSKLAGYVHEMHRSSAISKGDPRCLPVELPVSCAKHAAADMPEVSRGASVKPPSDTSRKIADFTWSCHCLLRLVVHNVTKIKVGNLHVVPMHMQDNRRCPGPGELRAKPVSIGNAMCCVPCIHRAV